jgi:hypothetical protein
LNCSSSIGGRTRTNISLWQHEVLFCACKCSGFSSNNLHYPIMILDTMLLIFLNRTRIWGFLPRFKVWFSVNEIFESTSSIEFYTTGYDSFSLKFFDMFFLPQSFTPKHHLEYHSWLVRIL